MVSPDDPAPIRVVVPGRANEVPGRGACATAFSSSRLGGTLLLHLGVVYPVAQRECARLEPPHLPIVGLRWAAVAASTAASYRRCARGTPRLRVQRACCRARRHGVAPRSSPVARPLCLSVSVSLSLSPRQQDRRRRHTRGARGRARDRSSPTSPPPAPGPRPRRQCGSPLPAPRHPHPAGRADAPPGAACSQKHKQKPTPLKKKKHHHTNPSFKMHA